MKIEEVLVVGAGVMGREVALQCAMFGYRTTVYDVSREALSEARAIIDLTMLDLAGTYVPDTASAIRSRLYYSRDLEEAAASADLVSENVPEDPELKAKVFAQLGAVAPPHAILTTNTSSIVPSVFAHASGRPERMVAMHFHKTVWISNIVDIMPHPGTNPALLEVLAGFARSIGQIPIVLQKEIRGYVFNSMQWAYLWQALALWSSGAASFEDIDRAWMIAERSGHGPFGAMDFVGLDTIHGVTAHWAEVLEDDIARTSGRKLKAELVDRGRLGVKTGVGFYRYPAPAFEDPRFIAPSGHAAVLPGSN